MNAAAPIAEILGLGKSVRTMQDLDKVVEAGLPKKSLKQLSTRLYPNEREAGIYQLKLIPAATLKRRTKLLSAAESQRIERVARVLAFAEYVLDGREEAREWMNTDHPELGGKTPLETARTEIGARRVEAVLNKLFFGLPA